MESRIGHIYGRLNWGKEACDVFPTEHEMDSFGLGRIWYNNYIWDGRNSWEGTGQSRNGELNRPCMYICGSVIIE